MSGRSWWQDGVFYQIYPRSYTDSNADGLGDLEGIRRRLDHLVWLGVDAIWLSPFYPSPMADFGYDVADYCDVDPLFGSLADFDRLLTDAHARDLRVIIDFVPAHTSAEHAWFQASRSSRDDPKRSWYVWRDPAPGGGPPNNWLSVFGGSAWEWDEATQQYYLHSHLVEQPDLDWRNPEVVEAMHGVLRFWLDRGVDGFRIDVIHRIAKDPQLRDNPWIAGREDHGYGGQQHLHDQDHPDVHEMLRGLRSLLDGYDARMMVGEVYLIDPVQAASYYGRGEDELHLAFNFSLVHAPWSAERFRDEIERFEAALPDAAWPDLVLSSHDASRHATRYDHPEHGEARTRAAALLLLALRGTPFLYQGEELGLRDVRVPVEDMQDPLARTLHPNVSRDPCRAPIPWTATEGHGFSEARPWLPFPADAAIRNVASQRDDAGSLLHFYRKVLAFRRRHPALHRGHYRSLPAPEEVFAWERRHEDERVVAAVNFDTKPRRIDLESSAVQSGIRSDPDASLPDRAEGIELAPGEGIVLVVDAGV